MDELFTKRHRRHVAEPNIVPILDMLTTVIFFLLLSTSFMEFTKLTLPPSRISTITDPVAPPPVSPKLMFGKYNEKMRLLLSWSGESPGEWAETLSLPEAPKERRAALYKSASESIKKWKAKFPKEKTLELGLGAGVPYQDMITLMDGTIETLPDIVLISPEEVDARIKARPPQENKTGD